MDFYMHGAKSQPTASESAHLVQCGAPEVATLADFLKLLRVCDSDSTLLAKACHVICPVSKTHPGLKVPPGSVTGKAPRAPTDAVNLVFFAEGC